MASGCNVSYLLRSTRESEWTRSIIYELYGSLSIPCGQQPFIRIHSLCCIWRRRGSGTKLKLKDCTSFRCNHHGTFLILLRFLFSFENLGYLLDESFAPREWVELRWWQVVWPIYKMFISPFFLSTSTIRWLPHLAPLHFSLNTLKSAVNGRVKTRRGYSDTAAVPCVGW